jgi:tetratricopeptide (TPR) repeat protein
MGTTAPTMLDLRRARRYVEAVPELHPGRRCLAQLVDRIESASPDADAPSTDDDRAEVGRMLASYAKLLQYEAQWGLAADVHETIVEFARRSADVPRMLDSMLLRGYALRMQGRLDDAGVAYGELRAAADAAGDLRYRLESDLSDAKLAVDRGNFPLARELLDRTIADARGADCTVIVSKGLTDRARIAAMQHDYELALACSYQALELTLDPTARERILSNIARTFAEMGLRDAARDAALLVAATAQDRTTRLTALVNLMSLAHRDGRELVFEQYRRDLAHEELSPYLEATYLENCAQGYRAFGREQEARHAAERMLAVAERHGLNEMLLRAEALLREAPVPTGAVAPAARPTERVASIARSIAEMRIAAGLSG